MNTSSYLSNLVIPPGFYHVRCLNAEMSGDPATPTIVAKLQVIPSEAYEDASEAILYVTIRGSQGAQRMHDLFRHTFRVENNPAEAIGRFGCVLVGDDSFQGTRYSGVHFINQSNFARQQARALELADEDGEIPWGKNDDADVDAFVL